MTTQEIQQEIITEFKGLDDCMDKYCYLIKLGKDLPAIAPEYKTDDTLLKGCQMKTWFHSACNKGTVSFDIDSRSLIVKGIAVLLLKILNGKSAEDIKNADLFFIDELDLRELFAPSRANSLWKMLNQMKTDAALYETETK